jgi:hypothetical protein
VYDIVIWITFNLDSNERRGRLMDGYILYGKLYLINDLCVCTEEVSIRPIIGTCKKAQHL